MKTDTRTLMTRMLADTLYFFRRNLFPLLVLAALIHVPYQAATHFLIPSAPEGQGSMAGGLLAIFLFLAIQTFHQAAQIRLFADSLEGRPWSLAHCLRTALATVLRLMPAYVIASVITALGALTFILPGLYLAARFAFYSYFIVLEGAEPVSALKASLAATKPYVWPLMGGMLLIGCPLLILVVLTTEQIYKTVPSGLVLGFWVVCSFIVATLIAILKFRFYCLSKEEMRAPFPESSPQ
ncbi:MAG: hypothetical protein WBG37_11370 [Desulfobacterales bacterium]|jgi:hypothetical protein